MGKEGAYRVPDDTHHELRNWARWCWLGEWPHPGMAMFAEDDDEPKQAPPNERHAHVVQAAWVRMHLEPRLVLRAEYPGRTLHTREERAKLLRMTVQEYETHLAWAVRQVQEAFNAVCA